MTQLVTGVVRKRIRERRLTTSGVVVSVFEMDAALWSGRRTPAAELLTALWATTPVALLEFPDEDALPIERVAAGQFLVRTDECSPSEFEHWTSRGHWRLWHGLQLAPQIVWQCGEDESFSLAVAAVIRGGWVVSAGADSDHWTVAEVARIGS